MANPNYQSGGAFLPGNPARITSSDPWNFDKAPTVGTDVGQGAQTIVTNPTAASITATGATGSTAAAVTVVPGRPAFLVVTGAANSGINLPAGVGGEWGFISNHTTGTIKVYATNSTTGINGTTGTTAVSITATGNLSAAYWCEAPGAWQVRFNT